MRVRVGVISTLVIAMGLFALNGCTWRTAPQPSVLVIAVENLGFGSFSCVKTSTESDSDPDEGVGFESFCQEGVRFTHAYAPSPMSQATMASLLTGLYPREHGVRHNGAQALPAKLVTLAEVARAHHFKTSFYSGGAPIWRRSAINQGFDIFDDNVPVSLKSSYRPAMGVIDLFLSWQSTEAPRGNFLSFLFLADPQFIDQPTTNDLDEVRESSYRSQVEEVSESVASLVKEMKKRKIWDTTTVILVGLDGYSADLRAGEPGAANLFSESTRATLMIKPARKKREGPFNWKIDSNVSLVDVGTTLFEMIAPGEPLPASKFETTSLASALNGPEVNWSADRKIVSESAWPEWRAVGGVRSAVRSGSFLYIFDVNDQLYNTLTDSLEFSPLPLKEPRTLALRDSLAQYLRDHDYVPWQASDALALEKTQLAQELWRERAPAADSYLRLRALSKRHPQDSDLLAWRAILALSRNDWVELKAAAGDDHPVWKYVAAINLGEKVARPLEPCLKALDVHTTEMRKACSDDYVRDIVTWVTETDPKIRDRAMESATKTGLGRALFDRISRQNAVAGDTWDVSRGALSEPPLSDLILALPEMKKYRIILRSKLASRVD